jgi:hypothetical protein
MSSQETVRLQLAWTKAHIHSTDRTTDEIIAQLIASF